MSTKQQAEKEWRRQRCNFIEEFTPVGLCISGHRPAEIKFHLAVGWFNPLFLMSEVRTLPNSRIGLRKRQLKFGVCQRHLFGIHRRETTCGRLRSVNAHDEWERFKFSRIGNSASFPNSCYGCESEWRSANKRGSNRVCHRTGVVRDSEAPRRSRILLRVDQWSVTTSYWKKAQHWETICKNPEEPKTKIKMWTPISTGKPVARFAWMVGGFRRESCGRKMSVINGGTRKLFSWIRYSSAERSDIG